MPLSVQDSLLCIVGRGRVLTREGSLTGRIVGFREAVTRAWRVLWMPLEQYEALPSRFQLREEVRVYGQRGTVKGVTFALMDFDDDWGEGGKVLYDVLTKQGLHRSVLSNDVEPGPKLRVVP